MMHAYLSGTLPFIIRPRFMAFDNIKADFKQFESALGTGWKFLQYSKDFEN